MKKNFKKPTTCVIYTRCYIGYTRYDMKVYIHI